MRQTTQDRIDDLHAQIAELVAVEKAHIDAERPDLNPFQRSVEHTRIDFQSRSPQHRKLMTFASATFPKRG